MFNKKGYILLFTLIFSLAGLFLLLGLSHLLIGYSKSTGSIRRYTTSMAAATGGALECINAIKECNLINNNFKCQKDSSTWIDFINNGFTSWTLEDLTSHTKPEDIINFFDWQKSYDNYQVFCKIVAVKGFPNGYLYAIEIVSRKTNHLETSWISIGYILEHSGS